jgi:hypothetical protein
LGGNEMIHVYCWEKTVIQSNGKPWNGWVHKWMTYSRVLLLKEELRKIEEEWKETVE